MVRDEDSIILENEVLDDSLDDLLVHLLDDSIKNIIIETDNISSLVLQQLYLVKDSKNIIVNNSFMKKFFDDVKVEQV